MHDYPLLNLFWTMLELFLWILWIYLIIKIISDIFRSPDLSGWGRAGWAILLIVFPFIGALGYLIFRGTDMHIRENRQAQANEDALRHYLRNVGGSGPSTADELHKLADLHQRGVLTDAEFEAQKAKLLV